MADYKKGFYWSKHSNQKSANWHSWDLRAKTTECQLALLGGKGLTNQLIIMKKVKYIYK